MALTRKSLKAYGLEENIIEQIIEDHSETVTALKEQREAYKADAEKYAAVKAELDELKAKPDDGYQAKYEAEHDAFEAFKADIEQQKSNKAKADAYKSLLRSAGVDEKRIETVVKVTDLSQVEMEGESIKDADKISEAIKTEWADFIAVKGTAGANVPNPPGKASDVDPSEMTTEQYMAYKAEMRK